MFRASSGPPYISFDPLGDVAAIAAVEEGDRCQAAATLLDTFLEEQSAAIINLDDIPDLSLGEDWHADGRSKDYVEPDPISAEAYFDLTDEEKREVARDAQGLPCGYWLWSKEAWNRYSRENPRTPNAWPPRERLDTWQDVTSGEVVTIDDFRAFMEMHAYIFTPSGAMWSAASVNSRIPPIPLVDKNGKPLLDDMRTFGAATLPNCRRLPATRLGTKRLIYLHRYP